MLQEELPLRRKVGLALLAAALLWFAWSIREVINPLLLGYLLAYILRPAVRRLEARGVSHRLAVATIFVVATVVTCLLGAVLAVEASALVSDTLASQPARNQVEQVDGAPGEPREHGEPERDSSGGAPAAGAPLEGRGAPSQSAPRRSADDRGASAGEPGAGEATSAGGADAPGGRWRWVRARVGELLGLDREPGRGPPSTEALWVRLRRVVLETEGTGGLVSDAGVRGAQLVWSWLGGFLDAIFGVANLALLVPVYAFFLLFEIDTIHGWIRAHLPRTRQEQLVRVARRVGEIVSNFFRGRLLVVTVKGTILTLALWLVGVPYPFLVGFTGGLLSLLPFIGGLVGFVLGVLAAALTFGWLQAVLISAAIFGGAELIEGYVLMPRLLGSSLGLSEVAVLFALTAGGAAFGLLGVLVALPVAATLKVLFLEFVEPTLEQWAES